MIATFLTAAALLPPVAGGYNPAVTQRTITSTVCVAGWTATVRPPVSYTTPLKRNLLAAHHLPGTIRDYQLDHLVSLELGGAPRAKRNLWMQPQRQARADDRLENRWHRLVCAGEWTLRYGRRVELRWKRAHG
jgi:hypothetical protein